MSGAETDTEYQFTLPDTKIWALHQEQLATLQEQLHDMSTRMAAYETRPLTSVPLAAGVGIMGPQPTSLTDPSHPPV